MPWWSSMKQPNTWSRNDWRMSRLSRSRSFALGVLTEGLAPHHPVPLLVEHLLGRSKKYGIQPISPSDKAIFRFGYRWNRPLNNHDNIVPDVREAPQVRFAMNGHPWQICGSVDDEPDVHAHDHLEFIGALAITGSQ